MCVCVCVFLFSLCRCVFHRSSNPKVTHLNEALLGIVLGWQGTAASIRWRTWSPCEWSREKHGFPNSTACHSPCSPATEQRGELQTARRSGATHPAHVYLLVLPRPLPFLASRHRDVQTVASLPDFFCFHLSNISLMSSVPCSASYCSVVAACDCNFFFDNNCF